MLVPLGVVLTVLCAAHTDAVTLCKGHIIKALRLIPECYHQGQVPRLLASSSLVSFVKVTKADITNDVACAIGRQDLPYAFVNVYFINGSSILNTYHQERKCSYILETDKYGIRYRIYVIHNRYGVYSYYRCVEDHQLYKGNGKDMMAMALSCDCKSSKKSWSVMQEARICFDKLNITETRVVEPCDC